MEFRLWIFFSHERPEIVNVESFIIISLHFTGAINVRHD